MQEFEAAAVSTRSLKAASCVNRFGLQSSVPLHAELLELLGLLNSFYLGLTASNSGTMVIAGHSTNPLSVSLISGMTDNGNRLKPM